MKLLVYTFSVLLFFCLFVAPSYSQDDTIPPPIAPFLNEPSDYSQWKIEVETLKKFKSDQAALESGKQVIMRPTLQLTEIRSYKFDNLKQDILIYADGSRQEYWHTDEFTLSQRPNRKISIHKKPSDELPIYGNLTVSPGYPGFDWLKLGYYRGVETLDDVTCYYFRLEVNESVESAETQTTTLSIAEAWVDTQTRRPVAYQANNIRYRYYFTPGSKRHPVMPKSFADAFKRFQLAKKRSAALLQRNRLP
ncbi:MAG: hypothetical protein AAF558_09935 [Verrucomicrobiota bacterium]